MPRYNMAAESAAAWHCPLQIDFGSRSKPAERCPAESFRHGIGSEMPLARGYCQTDSVDGYTVARLSPFEHFYGLYIDFDSGSASAE